MPIQTDADIGDTVKAIGSTMREYVPDGVAVYVTGPAGFTAVLSTSLFALCVALLSVWWLAKAGALLLNGQTQGILFILVIGAATDYSLLYVARYREELRVSTDKWAATMSAGGDSRAVPGAHRLHRRLRVLLDTFVVRSLMVPALTYDLGRSIWWPSKLGRDKK